VPLQGNIDNFLLLRNCNKLENVDQIKEGKHTVNLAGLDIVADILGAAAVDLAANGKGSTEDLEHGSAELLGERAVAHDAGDVDDLLQRDRLGVLNVLLLLAVTRGLLQGLDDKRRSRGDDGDGGLTVLDGELDSDTETFPVTSGLGNIFTCICC
jgi:hypothetical protein